MELLDVIRYFTISPKLVQLNRLSFLLMRDLW